MLDGFLGAGDNLDLRLLRAQARVRGLQPHLAGHFLGANPYCPRFRRSEKMDYRL